MTVQQKVEKNTKAGKADRAGKAQVDAKDAKVAKKTSAVAEKAATSGSTAAASDKAPKAATLKGAAAGTAQRATRVRPMKAMADRVTRALGLGKRRPAAGDAAPADASAAGRPRFSEGRLAQVLVAPIVSEKATMAGEKHNQVLFKVLRDATKPEIAAAVELMFKVKVDAVQTVQHKGKQKKFGRSIGRRDHIKKAYVCLAKGEQLNFSGESA